MGQKVNPKGLRLGIVNNWQSRWFFADKAMFRNKLVEDARIREAVMKKYSHAYITAVEIERQIGKMTVIVFAVKPGVVIGRGGKGLEELKKIIVSFAKTTKSSENKSGKDKKEIKIDIKVEPVKKPFLVAYYVAQVVADKLVRKFSHRSAVHNAMDKVIEAGAKGVKIQLGGRIGGAEISRREKYFLGTVPNSTIREDIDFAHYPALTKSGYIGVKVWVCRHRT